MGGNARGQTGRRRCRRGYQLAPCLARWRRRGLPARLGPALHRAPTAGCPVPPSPAGGRSAADHGARARDVPASDRREPGRLAGSPSLPGRRRTDDAPGARRHRTRTACGQTRRRSAARAAYLRRADARSVDAGSRRARCRPRQAGDARCAESAGDRAAVLCGIDSQRKLRRCWTCHPTLSRATGGWRGPGCCESWIRDARGAEEATCPCAANVVAATCLEPSTPRRRTSAVRRPRVVDAASRPPWAFQRSRGSAGRPL